MDMKKIIKFLALPLVTLLLASCEAKSPIMSIDAFKKNVLEEMETRRMPEFKYDYRQKLVSYKNVERDVLALKYTSLDYQIDSTKYQQMLDGPTKGVELFISSTTIANGKINYDEENGYSESGTGVTRKCAVTFIDVDPNDGVDELQFAYVYEDGATKEIVPSGIVHKAGESATPEIKEFVDNFFEQDKVVELYDELRGIYNGYIDEIKNTLDSGNSEKEILQAKTNYVYRYLDNAGYHEFQISNTTFTIDRVGFRADLDVQKASTATLSGF